MGTATTLVNLGAMHSLPRLIALCEKFIIASVDFEDAESALALLCFAVELGDAVKHLRSRTLYHLLHSIPRQVLSDSVLAAGEDIPPAAREVSPSRLPTQHPHAHSCVLVDAAAGAHAANGRLGRLRPLSHTYVPPNATTCWISHIFAEIVTVV